jgi:hypothetical protein
MKTALIINDLSPISRVFGSKSLRAFACSLALTACVSAPQLPTFKENPKFWETRVVERANQRWAHVRAGEFAKAHALYTEASRRNFTAADFERQIKQTQMNDGVAESAECTVEFCEVALSVKLTLRIPRVGNKQQTAPFRERWVIENGDIYLLRS